MWMGRVGKRIGAPCGVKAPLASFFDDRDGKRPVILAERESELRIIHPFEFGRFLDGGREFIHLVIVLHFVSRKQFLYSVGPKNRGQGSAIFCLGRVQKRFHSFFRRRE